MTQSITEEQQFHIEAEIQMNYQIEGEESEQKTQA